MSENIETVFHDLQQLIPELQKALSGSAGEVAAHAEGVAMHQRATLKDAEERLERLRQQLLRSSAAGTRAATHTLQANPWRSVAIAAAAGFVIGLVLGRADAQQ